MDEERFRQIEELYHAARRDRAALANADTELRRDVESLLAQDGVSLPSLGTSGAIVPGAQLGPYRIEALVGAGGMGEVYRAVDTRLKRTVAIKIAKENFSERFQREARAIAALNHPNICTLYDVGPNYLVMEFVEGESPKGPLPLEKALPIARQIADALEAAHEKNIVHRDLKPGNIKVKPDGVVKVLDFGLAKVAPASVGESLAETATLTTAGMILGTAAYMSPEQAQGKPVDKRADIWAFGAVLYELLTGRRTFQGETASDTMAAVLTKEPEWEQVPLQVQRLLRRCLEKDPRRRLRDIGDAMALLEEEAPRQATRSPAPLWAAIGALALALGGVAIRPLLRTPPSELHPIVRWTATLPPYPGVGSGVALSRDGTRLAYAEQTGVSSRIWIRMLDQPEGKPLPGTEGGVHPFLSPDGQWLAYFTGRPAGPLMKVLVAGGNPTTLCDNATIFGGSWGEDGTIVFAGSGGLMKVSASGGPCERVTTPDPQKREVHHWPQILPGGDSILFTIGTPGSFDSARAAVLDLKSGRIRELANGASEARYVPSGHLVYVRNGTMFAVPFDSKRLAVTGTETSVIEGVFYLPNGGFADYGFSNSGLLVYLADTLTVAGSALEWRDRKGGAQALSAPAQGYESVRLSPDGRRAAMRIHGRNAQLGDIWIYELARGALTRLTPGGENHSPVWTPDGGRVVFGVSGADRGMSWAPADGSGRPDLLMRSEVVAVPNSWTPDGKLLLYESAAPRRLWILQVPGTETKPRLFNETSFNESDAQISADGRWVAYTSDESGKIRVYARPFPGPGGKTPVSIEGGQEPRWSRDGRELFFRDPGKNEVMAADIQTDPVFRAGTPHALFELRTPYWDVTPDGKRFLVVKEADTAVSEPRMEAVVNWFEELRQKVGK